LPEARRTDIAQKTVARLKHLERLIQDMLLFARGEVLGREQFPVADLLAELAHTFEPLARRRQVGFEVLDAAHGVGEVMLTGNRKSLTGALTSFLENALHFVNEGGQVTLAARCEGASLRLSVRDNGRGMTPEVAARLFEPFYTTRAEGTGLGLAIARGVARAHGGSVEVVSSPGAGAEFILVVPLSAEAGSIS
jgi:two-component system sensor histidine kinase FlrB